MTEIDARYNPANEIVKYKFFEKVEHKDGKDPKTVNQYVNALHEFEVATKFRDFKKYNSDWAIEFKNYLSDKTNKRTGDNISKSLYFHYIAFVKDFFKWLTANRSDYSKIKQGDIEYLTVSRNDRNKAKATGHQESHDVSDILATIRKMPSNNELEMRNKAMISLCLLTTPRISSLQTASIKSIKYFKDYDIWAFVQDPRSQDTKFARNIDAFFIGQSQDIIQNVLEWRNHLISKGFKSKTALFPVIETSFDKDGEPIMQLSNKYMQSQTQIRDIFKKAFIDNGLPYYKPHSFRHSVTRLVRIGEEATDTMIVLSENAGQKSGYSVMINSYGGDSLQRRAKIIKNIKLE